MRVAMIFGAILTVLCGCVHDQFKTGNGDAGQFILQQALGYGGQAVTTNGLPAIATKWVYSQDDHGVVILLSKQQFPTVETFLRQAFGPPSFGPVDTTDGCKLGEYRLTSKGGGIQFSFDATQTQVVLIRPIQP